MRKKSTKKEIIDESIIQYNKYNNLLSYARKGERHLSIPGVIEAIEKIQKDFPDEVKQLHEDDTNWTHGFNSGCNAAFAFILTMSEFGIEQAKEEFPFLDT
jgi:hypothetical protein